jgi:hypothetical protein
MNRINGSMLEEGSKTDRKETKLFQEQEVEDKGEEHHNYNLEHIRESRNNSVSADSNKSGRAN